MREIFQNFMDDAVEKLSANSRICGLAIGGSWATGEIDNFSDLDLIVVSENEVFDQVFEDRFNITKSLGSHISSFTGEHVGEPKVLICLFKSPLIHVDIKFIPLKQFHSRILNPSVAWERDRKLSKVLEATSPELLETDPQWIEDRIWTWVHYGAVKIARGEIFETLAFLSFLREKVLAPLKKRELGILPFGVRKIEKYDPEFSKDLEKTVAIYERQSCFHALEEVIKIYRELRTRIPEITKREQAESEATKYLSDLVNSSA
jgi:predicted nucleotidyltransferase